MKKKLSKIITLLLIVAMSLSTFACQLIQVDMEKAYDQTVATVKVFDEDGAREDVITNSDVMAAYVSNGSYYIYTMGYSVEETLDLMLDSLVKNKITVQLALKYFNEKGVIVHSDKGIWDAERYLTDKEIAEAKYTVKKGVNEAIDSYIVEDETEDEKESYTPTARVAPTGAANFVHELTIVEMNDTNYPVDTGIANGNGTVNNKERRNAYYKLLKSMSENGYIEDDFDWNNGSILDTDYYKKSVKEQLESTLVSKYQRYLTYDYYKSISVEALASVYEDEYALATQPMSYTDFNSKLSSASESSPILYTSEQYSGKFAYVYNLLIGVDSIQSAKIAELDKTNTEQYRKDREDLLKDTTTAKDLRSTWITAGYDYDIVTNKFLNDYAVAGANTVPFQGTATWANEEGYTKEVITTDPKGTYIEYKKDGKVDKDYTPEYTAVANELSLDEVIGLVDTYLYGGSQNANVATPTSMGNIPVYRAVKSNQVINDDIVNELLFAFSTDTGSTNTYKGYVVAEDYELAYTETYVEEFAKAGRQLIQWAKDGFAGSYMVVATDYGYHIMIFNELVTVDANKDTLYAYLGKTKTDVEADYRDMLLAIRDEEVEDYEDDYLYLLLQSVASSSADSSVNSQVVGAQNRIMDDSNKVTINKDLLKNLLG